MFNVKRFLEQYNVPIPPSGKSGSPGWINIKCPFCTDHSNHGGFRLDSEKGWFHCRRCGSHPIVKTIEVLTGESYNRAYGIYRNFLTDKRVDNIQSTLNTTPTIKQPNELILPTQFRKMTHHHKMYLQHRGFDPDELEQIWDLMGTGFIGDYKFRIIAPIYLNKKLVSYQGRDITNKSKLKYKACEKKDEVVHHKHTLYGVDLVPRDICVVVEGFIDVLRIGPGAVATFGIKYKIEQVLMLNDKFNKVYILFDIDEEAIKQSNNLANDLSGLGTDVEILDLDVGDPGSMSKEDTKEIRSLIK